MPACCHSLTWERYRADVFRKQLGQLQVCGEQLEIQAKQVEAKLCLKLSLNIVSYLRLFSLCTHTYIHKVEEKKKHHRCVCRTNKLGELLFLYLIFSLSLMLAPIPQMEKVRFLSGRRTTMFVKVFFVLGVVLGS